MIPNNMKTSAVSIQPFSRTQVDGINAHPICLSDLLEHAPHPAAADMFENFNKIRGMIGGDDCLNLTVDLSDGFKLKIEKTFSAFNKDKFDMWGIVDMIKDTNPSL